MMAITKAIQSTTNAVEEIDTASNGEITQYLEKLRPVFLSFKLETLKLGFPSILLHQGSAYLFWKIHRIISFFI